MAAVEVDVAPLIAAAEVNHPEGVLASLKLGPLLGRVFVKPKHIPLTATLSDSCQEWRSEGMPFHGFGWGKGG